MERHGGTANHSKAYLRRPNPPSRKAKPHCQLETLQVFHGSVPSDVSGDRTSKGTESRGAPTIFRSQLHLENVPRTEEQRRSQTNFRPTRPQQTCQGRQVSTHFSFKDSRFSSGWRLDDPHRHVPSLPPRADNGVSSMPPSFRLQQGASSVDKLALWPFRCPSYLRNDHELDCRDSSITRYEGGRIFGRLSPRLSRQEQIIGADPRGSETVGVSRLEDQSRQVRSKPLSEDQIPGYPLEYQGQSHEPPLQKSSKNYGPIHEIHLKGTLLPERTSVPTRATKFCQLRHPQRATSLPPSSKIFNQVQATQTTAEANNNLSGIIRTNVVAISHVFFHSSTKAPRINYLTSDAADAGWGAQIDSLHLSGPWTETQKSWHSNKKVMFAVYAAIERMSYHLQSAHILLQTDKRTLVAYIQKEGGTRSFQPLNLTYLLLHILDRNNITLSAVYLPGRYNGIADRLSRANLSQGSTFYLTQRNEFSPNGANQTLISLPRQIQQYYALFTGAFSQPWHCKLGWLFPPPCLIPRVLAHLNKCKGEFLLVAPKWDQTFWMSDLSNRSKEQPLTIQNLETALIDTTTNQPPQQVERLTLQVWRIGCGRT